MNPRIGLLIKETSRLIERQLSNRFRPRLTQRVAYSEVSLGPTGFYTELNPFDSIRAKNDTHFIPDIDEFIVSCRGNDAAVFWMSPGDSK